MNNCRICCEAQAISTDVLACEECLSQVRTLANTIQEGSVFTAKQRQMLRRLYELSVIDGKES